MTTRDAWVVIPAKSFWCAKQRLSPLLTASERALLARSMLCDVLSAACGVIKLNHIAVVTNAEDVAQEAARLGTVVIDDGGADGTNAAVAAGLAAVENRGDELILVLPSDVPAILSEDVSTLLQAAQGNAVIVPAPRDGGTNAVAFTVARALQPCFGPDSFARHIAAADRLGIQPIVCRNARIGLDLDAPADVFDFLDLNTSTATDRYLRSINLGQRRLGMGTDGRGAQASMRRPK
ncbi:2-phospho-L-lactate guanylyltransferase [Bradyrhizobium sp. NBAIM03]|uniref:2-phospho-L-lactate guanylyltransferase n=1 Tax=unclassified Bradyrhizobium TaxID=2631580 RepID=UPI001CD22F23|nr:MULTISPECIES: 2-phospho-L-lactate guanylyltransferase [unclassified Bradyrhizobium]MCA1471109.1 2-phospho-L-lactate guanylyltransferase [Bradyrhizobium sp. IC3195]MCA1536791.1 2-phospho-L-lactate guanylyltransferase [Bradyrhizobium sp. NBAIM03]